MPDAIKRTEGLLFERFPFVACDELHERRSKGAAFIPRRHAPHYTSHLPYHLVQRKKNREVCFFE